MGRYDILHRIQQLDPEKDHVEIYGLTGCYEFPWDQIRSLEIALYRTYCVPSISALLDSTGEFAQRTQKRYDDTSLIVAEMSAFGYDSERGRAAQKRSTTTTNFTHTSSCHTQNASVRAPFLPTAHKTISLCRTRPTP